jgi:cysteine desulfurase/selenocysteine lyase
MGSGVGEGVPVIEGVLLGGGVLLDFACHSVDYFQWLCGRAVEVVAVAERMMLEFSLRRWNRKFIDAFFNVRHRRYNEARDIAFINSANSALSLLIGGLDWKPGDRIVAFQDEFPNNIYCPAVLERVGVEFVETPWERFYDAITPRTRLVVVSTVNYTNGFAPPLEEMGRFLRERNVLFFVDGTQSVGALRFDIGKVQPDMLAVHAYKWLLSPNGIGFMYVSPALRERLHPAVIGWRSHHAWRNVDNLHHGAPVFAASAEMYEGGMLACSLLYAMDASIGKILDIGTGEI